MFLEIRTGVCYCVRGSLYWILGIDRMMVRSYRLLQSKRNFFLDLVVYFPSLKTKEKMRVKESREMNTLDLEVNLRSTCSLTAQDILTACEGIRAACV